MKVNFPGIELLGTEPKFLKEKERFVAVCLRAP